MPRHVPYAFELTPDWQRRTRQALAESRALLDAIPPMQRDIGDPNHPIHSGLFGMDTAEFLARQYLAPNKK